MIQTFCLHFTIKKTKMLADGTAPLYLRITIEGQRFELSTKRYIAPAKWNSAAQKMNGNTEEARVFNLYLKTFEQQIYEVHRQMMERKILLTVKNLKEHLTRKNDHAVRYLIPIFKDHNKRMEGMVGKGYAPGTLERYETSLSHTLAFLKWQYKALDIDIKEINNEFINAYEYYLRTEKSCCNNTAVKYLMNFKKIVLICLKNQWLDSNPFVHYKSKITEVIPEFLTSEELQRLSEKTFVSERVNQVRDIFLFSCYTGLAYVDVKKLNRSDITLGIDGKKWIMTSRQKTETPSRIPLLQIALDILKKYENNPKCLNEDRLLPVLSNQKMNAYLKEIADLCDIPKELSYHSARHTFATTVTLGNGVPIESVSKMLGHKKMTTTQHYAKITDRKLSNDMETLRQKFGG